MHKTFPVPGKLLALVKKKNKNKKNLSIYVNGVGE